MSNQDFHKDEFYDAYIMGKLSAEEEDLFEEHLLYCEQCRKEIEMREAIVAGTDSDENIYIREDNTKKLSQKGIIIRLSIAASVLIIAGYSLYSIFGPPKDIGIATQKESETEAAISSANSEETGIHADSVPVPEIEKQSENMISEAFIPSPMFENAIENQVRSEGFSVLVPENSQIFKANDTIEFQWKNSEKQLTLVIFNNKGSIIYEKKVESPFALNKKFQPGLYYWQLETDDEALQTLKFIVQ